MDPLQESELAIEYIVAGDVGGSLVWRELDILLVRSLVRSLVCAVLASGGGTSGEEIT